MDMVGEEIRDIRVLKLFDRFDASCTLEFRQEVTSLIEAKKLKILIDMSDVTFIDSSGLGVLVSCLRSVTKEGGTFKITSLRNHPRQVFEITRLSRVFDIYENKDAALESFKIT